jgi:hypothetical protein
VLRAPTGAPWGVVGLGWEEYSRQREEVAGMKFKSVSGLMGRLRQRRERRRRDSAERVAKRSAAQSGPDRTGRGDQWMGPGGG